jgi:hypothetical protein
MTALTWTTTMRCDRDWGRALYALHRTTGIMQLHHMLRSAPCNAAAPSPPRTPCTHPRCHEAHLAMHMCTPTLACLPRILLTTRAS